MSDLTLEDLIAQLLLYRTSLRLRYLPTIKRWRVEVQHCNGIEVLAEGEDLRLAVQTAAVKASTTPRVWPLADEAEEHGGDS